MSAEQPAQQEEQRADAHMPELINDDNVTDEKAKKNNAKLVEFMNTRFTMGSTPAPPPIWAHKCPLHEIRGESTFWVNPALVTLLCVSYSSYFENYDLEIGTPYEHLKVHYVSFKTSEEAHAAATRVNEAKNAFFASM